MQNKFITSLRGPLKEKVTALATQDSGLTDVREIETALYAQSLEAYGIASETAKEKLIEAALVNVDYRSDRMQSVALNESRVKQDGQVNLHAVTFAIESTMKAMLQELIRFENIIDGPPQMIMDAVQIRVRETLQITNASVGTTLTPDMDAREMDASIPYVGVGSNGRVA